LVAGCSCRGHVLGLRLPSPWTIKAELPCADVDQTSRRKAKRAPERKYGYSADLFFILISFFLLCISSLFPRFLLPRSFFLISCWFYRVRPFLSMGCLRGDVLAGVTRPGRVPRHPPAEGAQPIRTVVYIIRVVVQLTHERSQMNLTMA
jgi:hypothetical protein